MFWERFYDLCRMNGKTPNFVAKELGLSSGSVTSWKKGKVPHHGSLLRIAEYFAVSVDYLLGGVGNIEKKAEDAEKLFFLEEKNIYMIPLFEGVSAGFGAYPDDSINGFLPCYIESESEARDTICIKVNGDSMFPKIEEGDTIQVRRQTSVDSGSIAVVLLDGEEALVKKLIYGPNYLELHSFNPMYPIRRFEGKDIMRVQVLGLVRKIIKEV